MARSFLTPINLNQLELQNARIQNLATAPSSPVAGQIYYDTTVSQLKVYEGTGWAPVGGVATGAGAPATSPLSTGSMYLDTTNSLLYVSNGTASSANWIPVMPYGLTSDIANLNSANASGSSLKVARADHVHRHIDTDHSGIHLNALATATGAYSMGGYQINNVATPTASTDAANKGYVDATAQGLSIVESAEAATTSSLTTNWAYTAGTAGADGGTGVGATLVYSAAGTFTIDGHALVTGDRVLVKNQVTGSQNGIYTVGTTGGSTLTLTRATDYDNHIAGQVGPGDFIFVTAGTTNGSTGWVQTQAGTSTTPTNGTKLGTDSLSWTQFSGTGAYTASNGVLLTGTNFTFNPLSTGGLATGSSGGYVLLPSTSGLATSSSGLTLNPTSTGGLTTNSSGALILLNTTSGMNTTSSGLAVTPGLGITITGQGAAGAATNNQVAINTDVVVRKYAATIGDGTTTSFTITHNMATKDVQVTLYDNTTNVEYTADVTHSTTNTVTVAFANAPSSNQIRVVVFA